MDPLPPISLNVADDEWANRAEYWHGKLRIAERTFQRRL